MLRHHTRNVGDNTLTKNNDMKTLKNLFFFSCLYFIAGCISGKQENIYNENKELKRELYANEYGEIELIKENDTLMRTILKNNIGEIFDTTMFINHHNSLISKQDSLPYLQLGMTGIELRNECLIVHEFSNIEYILQFIQIEELYSRPFFKVGKAVTVEGDVRFAKGLTINGIWLYAEDYDKIPESYVAITGIIKKEKYPLDYYSTEESPQGMFSDTSVVHYRLIMKDYTIQDIPK